MSSATVLMHTVRCGEKAIGALVHDTRFVVHQNGKKLSPYMTKSPSQHNPGDLVLCTFGRSFQTLGSSQDLCVFLCSYFEPFYKTTMATLLHKNRIFSVHKSYVKNICEHDAKSGL